MESSLSPNRERIIKRDRSASYPAVNLEDAIKFATPIAKSFSVPQVISRDDMAAVLGKAAPSITREVSACVQFGLLTREKEGYKVSPLLKTILNYISEEEKSTSIGQAFTSPKLYNALIEKYNGHLVPNELKTYFIRFYKIAEKAAPLAATIFFESAKFAGVLSDSNILNVKEIKDNIDNDSIDNVEKRINYNINNPIAKENHSPSITNSRKVDNNDSGVPLLLTEIAGEERIKIRLTENKICYLTLPQNLNLKDIQILNKQIEMLEILVE